jgi:RhoGEF domain
LYCFLSSSSLFFCRSLAARPSPLSQRTHRKKRCQGLDLDAFLIMPIQRVPRYLLYLKDLRRSDPSNTKTADQALENLEAIMYFINEGKRKAEGLLRVAKLQRQLLTKKHVVGWREDCFSSSASSSWFLLSRVHSHYFISLSFFFFFFALSAVSFAVGSRSSAHDQGWWFAVVSRLLFFVQAQERGRSGRWCYACVSGGWPAAEARVSVDLTSAHHCDGGGRKEQEEG